MQVYHRGNVSLYCGDMREVSTRLSNVNLLCTDPPYKLTSGGNTTKRMKGGIFNATQYDNSGNLFRHMITYADWVGAAVATLHKRGADALIFSNDRSLYTMFDACYKAGLKHHNVLAWDKTIVTPNRWYMKRLEFIAYFYIHRAREITNRGSGTLLPFRPKVGNRIHPTEKPVELMQFLIVNSCDEGDLVYDPFAGSGSTAVACIQSNRRFVGAEKDPVYWERAVERIDRVFEDIKESSNEKEVSS